MSTGEDILEILQALDKGVILRPEIRLHVGMALVKSGSVDDIKTLPLWIREDLVEWAREFEKSKIWVVISSGDIKDISADGLKLLSLLRDAGVLI